MKAKAKKPTPANIVWFEIPVDDLKRGQKFYKTLFGWKITPFRGMPDFLEIDTAGPNASPNGGMMKRKHPQHSNANYIAVASVDKHLAKVQKLGGKICVPKTAVPKMGYFAVCLDPENNVFGLWEMNSAAK